MRHEKSNVFYEFGDWLQESMNGVKNASLLTETGTELAQNAWNHGFEAGYHEGHVDGWNLAIGCWERIETAPKDNRRILLWDGNLVLVGSWYRESWTGDDYETIDATHWMPIPNSPDAEKPESPPNT